MSCKTTKRHNFHSSLTLKEIKKNFFPKVLFGAPKPKFRGGGRIPPKYVGQYCWTVDSFCRRAYLKSIAEKYVCSLPHLMKIGQKFQLHECRYIYT